MESTQTVDFGADGLTDLKSPDADDAHVASKRKFSPQLAPSTRLSTANSSGPLHIGELRVLYWRRLREVGLIASGTWWLLFAYVGSGVNELMNALVLGIWFIAVLAVPVAAFPACLIWMTARPAMSMRILRVVEWVYVITTLVPLLVWRYISVQTVLGQSSDEGAALAVQFATAYCNFPCTAMIIVYGVFVPNTRRRNSVMLALLSLGVAATDLLAWVPHLPDAGPAFADSAFQTTVMLFLSLATASYGSFKFGALQEEALVARETARRLGQYNLTRLLGAGAMGEVYLAEHRFLKRPCAVKLVRPDRAGDPRAIARFEREVQSTARLTHPNVVEIYDYGRTEDGTFYYAMEYLDGMSLDEVIRRFGPLKPARALHLFLQLCAALRTAHHNGLVHRDIKPSNIFVCRRGELYDVVKLLDFGLVHAIAKVDLDRRLTQDGGIVGTPEYMSPEQADGGDTLDGRTDIYAVGGVLHFMLTGRPPFVRSTMIETLIAHRQAKVPLLRDSGIEAGAQLEALLQKCLAKSPADRYADARELTVAAGNCPEVKEWGDEAARNWWQSERIAGEKMPIGEGSTDPCVSVAVTTDLL